MTASPARRGEFRLWRQGGGLGAYAQVVVESVPGGSGAAAVGWGVDPADGGSARPGSDDDLVEAALAGAREALRSLADAGVDVQDRLVRIVRVGMSLADSTPPAVRVAAAAATVDAFGAADRFEVVYDKGWHLRLRT